MSVMVISILFTVGVLLLTLLTISKGYGYKHTVDQLEKEDKKTDEKTQFEQLQ